MRSVLGVILAMVMVLGFARPSMVHAVDKGMDSAVRIEYSESGAYWRTLGSGVSVRVRGPFSSGPQYGILTAHHVAEYIEEGYLRACKVRTNNCVILDVYTHTAGGHETGLENDWSVMHVYKLPRGSKPAKVSKQEPQLGQEVAMIGHPWGEFNVKHGTLGSFDGWRGQSMYSIDGYVAGGMSGGPVYDMRGRVIGIVSASPIRRDYPFYIPFVDHNEILVVPVFNTGL